MSLPLALLRSSQISSFSSSSSSSLFLCFSRSFASQSDAGQKLKQTALYEWHKGLNAKMVPFCGWEMPVQYPDGVLKSHLHTREKASLFDVSHMGQLRFTGKDRINFFEKLVVADLEGLPKGSSRLSVFTNEKGGIIDDTVITQKEDHLYVVVNAGCADKDIAHLRKHLAEAKQQGKDVQMTILEDRSLIALQGPSAVKVLSGHVKIDLSKVNFMTSVDTNVAGIPCIVTRCGYTGEDGFEISVPSKDAVKLANIFLESSDVLPAGLGPRDSLRLEAGLCLYGNDIDETTTPPEAGLSWLISQRRRTGGFLGDSVILAQLKAGVKALPRRRVGLTIKDVIAREHTEIHDQSGKKIGEITSGSFSPCLKHGIAMGYVPSSKSSTGEQLQVVVRSKSYPAVVSKLPFVPSKYYEAK